MFAERLKNLRKERGYTQKQVAEGANIVEGLYQVYEYGQKKPGHENLIALADFFEVSTDYLLGCTDDPRRYR